MLSASWLSRATHETGHPRINTRGVALVLALANYFKSAFLVAFPPPFVESPLTSLGLSEHSMWSKDIIFVIGDDYVAGTQAWLDAYHGFGQDSASSCPGD